MPKYSRLRPGHILAERWFAKAGLEALSDSYRRHLVERGYATQTVESYFRSAAHFVHWASQQGIAPNEVDDALIDRFLYEHLPHCHFAPRCKRTRTDIHAAVRQFLEMPSIARATPASTIFAAIAREVTSFNRHLTEVRGLSDSTCSARCRHVLEFLIDRFGSSSVNISKLVPQDVSRFVLRRTRGLAPSAVKTVGISLRSYFLFKASRGIPTTALIAALPRVALWRLARLPDVLSSDEIRQLLGAFDRNSRTGMRDYAITRCLLDLGLRRMEVANLRLDDIDWRGLRISEATALTRSDVDLEHRLLHVRCTKFGKSRWVPIHPTTADALRRYARKRDRDPLTTNREAFFVFDYGRPASTGSVNYAFHLLCNTLQWRPRGDHPRLRLHDLRHSFVCHRLQQWYARGLDVDGSVLALSTYLGHAKVTDTYWYETATPELLAIAAQRFVNCRGGTL